MTGVEIFPGLYAASSQHFKYVNLGIRCTSSTCISPQHLAANGLSPQLERISVTVHPLHCLQAAQSVAAPAASALAPPPPPPVTFASNSNGGGSSSGAFSSTIGDVFTYRPSTGGSIESAGAVGPSTTVLTTNNGARPAFHCICILLLKFKFKTLNLEP